MGERDAATSVHMERVGALATQVALPIGCTETEAVLIGLARRLHDIGKVAMPGRLLMRTDRLTPDEQRCLEHHPVVGTQVLHQNPPLRSLAAMGRCHHEHWDGNGYPDGLQGEQSPLVARLIAIVDAYDAMTAGRPYAPARTASWAQAKMLRCAGTQFDPQVVAVFLTLLQEDRQAA